MKINISEKCKADGIALMVNICKARSLEKWQEGTRTYQQHSAFDLQGVRDWLASVFGGKWGEDMLLSSYLSATYSVVVNPDKCAVFLTSELPKPIKDTIVAAHEKSSYMGSCLITPDMLG